MADQLSSRQRHRQRFRGLTIEALETRHLLSGAPTIALGQPGLEVGAEAETGPTVQAQLAIVAAVSDTDHRDGVPDSVGRMEVGAPFFVEIWVQDSSATPTGIVGGYLDIRYTAAIVDSTGASGHGGIFDLLASGTVDDAAGHVDDFGGGTWSPGQGAAPNWARFGYLEFTAAEPGVVSFDLEPGLAQFSRWGIGNVPWAEVSLTGAEARVVAPPLWQNHDAPHDVNLDGLVTSLDVLVVIHAINSASLPPELPTLATPGPPPPFVDVNGDGFLTPLDVLLVINRLNSDATAEGEDISPRQALAERRWAVASVQTTPGNENGVPWAQYESDDEWLRWALLGTDEELGLGTSPRGLAGRLAWNP